MILKYCLISSVTTIIYHETPLQSLMCEVRGSFLNPRIAFKKSFLPIPISTATAEQITSNLKKKI